MTVSDLIETLMEFDLDKPVIFSADSEDYMTAGFHYATDNRAVIIDLIED